MPAISQLCGEGRKHVGDAAGTKQIFSGTVLKCILLEASTNTDFSVVHESLKGPR